MTEPNDETNDMEQNVNANSLAKLLLELIPKIKGKVQLSALLASLVAFVLVQTYKPGNVVAQIASGFVGIPIIVFTLFFNTLSSFEPEARPRLVLWTFSLFMGTSLVAMLVLAYIFTRAQIVEVETLRKTAEAFLESRSTSVNEQLSDLLKRTAIARSTGWDPLEMQELDKEREGLLKQQQQIRERLVEIKSQKGGILKIAEELVELKKSLEGSGTLAHRLDDLFRKGDIDGLDRMLINISQNERAKAAKAQHLRGKILEVAGRYREAESAFNEALQIDEMNPVYLEALAHAQEVNGDFTGAEAIWRRLIKNLESAQQPTANLSLALNRLGTNLRYQGKEQLAVEAFARAWAVAQQTTSNGEIHRAEVANAYAAYFQWTLDDYRTAENLYLEAKKIYDALADKDKKDRVGYHELLNNIGILYVMMGRIDEGIQYLENSISIQKEHFTTTGAVAVASPAYAITVSNLARGLAEKGRYAESEIRHKEAIAHAQRVYGDSHSRVGRIKGLFGETLLLQGEVEKACEQFTAAYALVHNQLSAGNPSSIAASYRMAECLLAQGNTDGAKTYIEEARSNFEKSWNYPLLRAQVDRVCGLYEQQVGNLEDAELYLRKSLNTLLGVFHGVNEHTEIVRTKYYLARILSARGNREAASGLLSDGLSSAGHFLDEAHPLVKEMREALQKI